MEGDPDKVVVVAAAVAWPVYQQSGGYVCQVGRTFQNASRFAFYSGRTIHGAAALVRHVIPRLQVSESDAARRLLSLDPLEQRVGDILRTTLLHGHDGSPSQVVVLTPLWDSETVRFEPIPHKARTAWTMGQRYAKLQQLASARSTEDLAS